MNDDQQTPKAAAATQAAGATANTTTEETNVPSEAVDSQGTDADSAREMLRSLRDKGFDGSDEKLAVVLGRPTAEVTALISGDEIVDDDVVMKARGIAQQRGIEIN